MGLSVDNGVRTAFFRKYDAYTRGAAHALSPSFVCVDLSAVLRQCFPSLGPGNHSAAAFGRQVLRKYVHPFTTATTIVVAFDSYAPEDLHQLRQNMHSQMRHRKATAVELDTVDAGRQVIVNGRIYAVGKEPYPDAEVDAWTVNTPVDPNRAVAGRKGKLKLYDLVLVAMLREVAEVVARPNTAAAEGRTVIFDTPRRSTDPEGVTLVRQTGGVVTVSHEPRLAGIGLHGEADQKLAAYLCANRGRPSVWCTADYDAVAQAMALELPDVCVAYAAPRGDKDRSPQLITMSKLPLGTAAAFGLLRDGGDYCGSAKVFNVHSEQILAQLDACSQPIWLEDGALRVDRDALFGVLRAGQKPRHRKRKIYHVVGADDESEYYLSRAAATLYHGDAEIAASDPTALHFQRSVREIVIAIAYWLYAATPDSTTRPAMDLDGAGWEVDVASADRL